MSDANECDDHLNQATRTAVLERDEYRCQTCGREGPERGGLATLHVHHIERDPDDVAEHDPANLTTLCRRCHVWHHQQADAGDVPVEITEADRSVLLPQDTEILRVLADQGPLSTGEIAAAVAAELSVDAIRERLWTLMGLDNIVGSRDEQIVDKDVETGEWGLVGQIERSARGHIPDDSQLLLQRIEDEMVRSAIDRGCDRNTVTSVFDISRRSSFYKEKRAAAYGFPLAAIRNGNGGSQPTDDHDDCVPEGKAVPEDSGQQRLDAVSDPEDSDGTAGEAVQRAGSNTDGSRGTPRGDATGGQAAEEAGDDNEVRAELRQVIESLQAVEQAL